MNTANVYETLYSKMQERFTIEDKVNHCEYNLGEFMLMKAGKKIEKESSLPAERSATAIESKSVISAVFSYVNDKLTLKAAPAKDKTIRRFPFRTSLAAVLSAVVACTIAISYGSAALRSSGESRPTTAEASENYDAAVEEIFTTQK